jgi:hypothetical protein
MKRTSLLIAASLCILTLKANSNPLPMHYAQRSDLNFASVIGDPPGAKPKLAFYGGPVLSKVKVYVIFWGPDVNSEVKTKMADFYKGMIETGYTDWLSEYNTTGVTTVTGHPQTDEKIVRGSFGGEINLVPFNKSLTIKDSEIRNEIEAQIVAGNLPTPDNNTLFMFHFPPGMTIDYDTLSAGNNCQGWCAYHSDYHRVAAGGQYVAYSVMPDYSSGACALGCGTAKTSFENLCGGSSHEIVESITDPLGDDVGAGKAGYPMAWWWDGGTANSQGEIGDVCAYNSADGQVTGPSGQLFHVQGEWSNSRNTCYEGPFGKIPALVIR